MDLRALCEAAAWRAIPERELGIRIALGAPLGGLKAMVVRHGVFLTAIGVALGLVAAATLTRLMASLLFEISPIDPMTTRPSPAVCWRPLPRRVICRRTGRPP